MTLKSRAFSGNPKLEAVAFSDLAYIETWDFGDHVEKIQKTLVELDNAVISSEDISQTLYGPSTARAVEAFKWKRNITERSCQNKAQHVVGKETIEALDREMLANENATREPIKLEPVSSQKRLPKRSPVISGTNLMLNFAFSNSLVQAPNPQFDNVAIDIKVFGVGSFQIVNGIGGVLVCDPNIVAIFDPDPSQLTAANFVPVTKSPQVFNVRGLNPGLTIITLQKPFAPVLSLPQPVMVVVRAQTKVIRNFIKGVEHNHAPAGKWSEISKDPKNGGFGFNNEGGFALTSILNAHVLTPICMFCSTPRCVIDKVISLKFGSLPIAKSHIDFYLSGGGRDFNEDTNIAIWIRSDRGIRTALKREVENISDKSGRKAGHLKIEQGIFNDTDFQFSFGAIDRLDFEFDFDLDECSVWFQDRYEWHPVYEGLYSRFPDDDPRETNCLHAAFVEMKAFGASDYWMKGEATVPMEDIFR